MQAHLSARSGSRAHATRPFLPASQGGISCTRVASGRGSRGAVPGLRRRGVARQRAVITHAQEEDATAVTATSSSVNDSEAAASNGSGSNGSADSEVAAAVARVSPGGISISPEQLELRYQAPSGAEQWWTKAKLTLALPWRRFPKDAVLTIKLEGELSDQVKGWLEPGFSVPQICSALQRAALDPRVKGLAIEVAPLSVGYAKLQEIRRYIQYFRDSGKFTVAYMKQAGEKEYYIGSACAEVYIPPSASISLRGFVVGGTFLRGVLDKIGVEPQVERIGEFKSAGDQLLRRDMGSAQREQLTCILEDTEADWVRTIAAARNKTEEQVRELLNSGVFDNTELLNGGWVDGLKYEDEVLLDLKKRTGIAEDKIDKKPLRKVGVRKLNSVLPGTYGPVLGNGKKRIVVLRTAGAILGKSSGSGGTITPDVLVPRLRALATDKSVAGVVLRVDSPGGDALASDLMWREVVQLGQKKPVVASMADVAASGGYYISMAARAIVAEPLTVTGSIGVVTGKFNLQDFYGKIGYSKQLISKGRYAELLADQRPFTEDEKELFQRSAQHAYEEFRNKAAESRKMAVEAMQQVAQGRVWTGRQALEQGLVDALGGVHAAVQLVRQAAGIPPEERVTITEVGTGRSSALSLLRGATTAALMAAAQGSTAGASPLALLGLLLAPGLATAGAGPLVAVQALANADGTRLSQALGASTALAVAQATQVASAAPNGVALCVEPENLGVQAAGSAALLASSSSSSPLAGAAGLRWPWTADDEVFLSEK